MSTDRHSLTDTAPSPQSGPGGSPRHRFTSMRYRTRWQAVAVVVMAVLVAVVGIVVAAGGTGAQATGDVSLGARALQDLSPFERQVLADKHVTAHELDEAIHTFTDCLTEAGIRYEIAPGTPNMSNVIMYGGLANGWDPTAQDDYDQKMEHCVDQVSAAQNVWILQNPGHVPGAQPLPGLKDALDRLDTSGW